jgi:hypothetical protein
MKTQSRLFPLTLLALAAISAPAAAQTASAPQALPDPATITVPDVTPSADPKVHEEGYKFYYFHSPEVSFAEAYRDLKECRRYLITAGPAIVPGFIPWDEAHRRRVRETAPPFGLAGGVMAAMILPTMERGVRSDKMRRCMGTRGYDRYAIPEAAWKTLNYGDEEQLTLMQAKLASGPKPQDEAVTR